MEDTFSNVIDTSKGTLYIFNETKARYNIQNKPFFLIINLFLLTKYQSIILFQRSEFAKIC